MKKTCIKIIIWNCLLLGSFINLFSAESFQLQGTISDSISGKPLIGALIIVAGTNNGAVTNINGQFIIKNLAPREYKFIASYIGYNNFAFTKSITKDETFDFKMIELNYNDQLIKSITTRDVVVSANKRVQAVQDVPISMSVMDSKILTQRGTTRLDNALEYMPGIEVNTDNVSIRGSSGFSFGIGSRVALLIDGFPILSGDNGDIKFDAVPIFNINRIEVVKGAGSALYGTGALGGVINVITTAPTETPVFNYRAYTGIFTQPRYEQWKYTDNARLNSGMNLGFMQKIDDLSVNLSAGYYNNQSYRYYDDSYSWNLFGKFAYKLSDFTELTLMANSAAEDRADWVYWRNLDSATLPPISSDISIRINSFKHSVYSSLRHIFDDNNFLNAKAGLFITEFSNNYTTDNPEYRQSLATQFNTEIQGNSKVANNLQLTYGVNYMHINVDSKTYGIQNQQIYSFYTQAEYDGIQSMILTAGGRFDLESADGIDNNLQFSPKIGMSYNLLEDFNLRASIGNGFRVPTVAERYASVSFQGFKVIPNMALLPEKSWSFEAGFNYEFKLLNMPFFVDAALFNNELVDLIEPSFATSGNAEIQFKNITSARINGIELSLRTFLFNMIGLESSITYMNPKDLTKNEDLKYRPNYLFYNKMILPLCFVEFQADYRFKNRFENVDKELGLIVRDIDARVDIHILDVRAVFDIQRFCRSIPLSVTLSANNLLDYYYAEMVGNLGSTRYISLRIDGKF